MVRSSDVRPLTESGVLTGITAVLALVSLFVPVIGSFTLLVIPLPVVLLAARHGIRFALLASSAAGAVVGLFNGPLAAINILAMCAFMGTAVGYGIRRRFSAVRTILLGTAGAVLYTAVSVGAAVALTGINPLSLEADFLQQTVKEAVSMKAAAASESEAAAFEAELLANINFIVMVLPAILILAQAVLTYINYFFARKVLRRLGTEIPALPKVQEWRLPQEVVYFYVLSLVGKYWGITREIGFLTELSANVGVLTLVLGVLQGVGLLFSVADKYRVSSFVRGMVLILVLFTAMFQIVGIIGLCDMVIDYRKRLLK